VSVRRRKQVMLAPLLHSVIIYWFSFWLLLFTGTYELHCVNVEVLVLNLEAGHDSVDRGS